MEYIKETANRAADAISKQADYIELKLLPKVALFKKDKDSYL